MNRKINHIKAHPEVYIGLCGVRHDSVGPEVGFVMSASGLSRCEDCLKKATEPGYLERRLKRIKAIASDHSTENRLRVTVKSFRRGEGAYSDVT